MCAEQGARHRNACSLPETILTPSSRNAMHATIQNWIPCRPCTKATERGEVLVTILPVVGVVPRSYGPVVAAADKPQITPVPVASVAFLPPSLPPHLLLLLARF